MENGAFEAVHWVLNRALAQDECQALAGRLSEMPEANWLAMLNTWLEKGRVDDLGAVVDHCVGEYRRTEARAGLPSKLLDCSSEANPKLFSMSPSTIGTFFTLSCNRFLHRAAMRTESAASDFPDSSASASAADYADYKTGGQGACDAFGDAMMAKGLDWERDLNVMLRDQGLPQNWWELQDMAVQPATLRTKRIVVNVLDIAKRCCNQGQGCTCPHANEQRHGCLDCKLSKSQCEQKQAHQYRACDMQRCHLAISLDAIARFPSQTVLYQPMIQVRPDFLQPTDGRSSAIKYSACYPDYLVLEPGDDDDRDVDQEHSRQIIVVDAKASKEVKLSHRVQVALYGIMLKEHVLKELEAGEFVPHDWWGQRSQLSPGDSAFYLSLKEQGYSGGMIDEFYEATKDCLGSSIPNSLGLVLSANAGVWLPNKPQPDCFALHNTVAMLHQFLQDKLHSCLNKPNYEAGVEVQDWHLKVECRSCKFQAECHKETVEKKTISSIPYLNDDNKTWLEQWERSSRNEQHRSTVADIEDLGRHLGAALRENNFKSSERKRLSQVLAVEFDFETGKPFAECSPVLEAFIGVNGPAVQVKRRPSLTLPAEDESALFVSLLYSPQATVKRLYAFGMLLTTTDCSRAAEIGELWQHSHRADGTAGWQWLAVECLDPDDAHDLNAAFITQLFKVIEFMNEKPLCVYTSYAAESDLLVDVLLTAIMANQEPQLVQAAMKCLRALIQDPREMSTEEPQNIDPKQAELLPRLTSVLDETRKLLVRATAAEGAQLIFIVAGIASALVLLDP